MKRIIPIILLAAVLTGCATFYQSVVTITTVADSAMKQWASLSVSGQTTPAVDAAVIKAHNEYRAACNVAETALLAYKASGDSSQYIAALEAARVAATGLIDLIVPLVTKAEGTTLKNNLSKAHTL